MINKSKRARGAVLLYVTIAMVAFVGIVSLAVDVGHVRLVRNQLQGAADAAARSAATGLETNTTTAQNNAVASAASNTADGSSVVVNPNTDVVFGTWSSAANTFTVLTGFAANSANAVQVICHRTAAGGNPVNLMFAGLIGKSTCDVTTSATAALPSGAYGIIGLNSLTMSGSAQTDSYNSSVGPYSSSSAGNGGSIESNGNITLSGGTTYVHGNASPGIGMSVNASGGSGVWGSTAPLTSTLSFPVASAGSYATTNSNSNVSTYVNNGSFNTSGSQAATMPGGTYYFKDFTMSGSSTLTVTGQATIYVTGQFDVSGSVYTTSNVPANLTVNVTSTQNSTLSGSTSYDLILYAPLSNVTVSGSGGLYGSVVGSSLTISGSGGVHYDQSLGGGGSTVVLVQ